MFKLVSALSKIQWTDQEVAFMKNEIALLDNLKSQNEFFDYCLKWKMAPWVFLQLKKLDQLSLFDKNVLQNFEEAQHKIEEQNKRRNDTARIFLDAFNEKGIDAVILKGNYLATTAYNNIGYKRMNDVDILIHKKDWDRIQDVYLELEYIPLGFGWSGEKEEPASFSHVGMSFISRDYSCIIGSQWGIKSPTTEFTVDIDKLWANARPFNFNGIMVKSLSPEHNLLHLILHLGIFKCGIRDCMDLYNLMLSEPIDEATIITTVLESNAAEKAIFAFEMSNLCTPQFSDGLIQALKKQVNKEGFVTRRIIKRKQTAKEFGDFQVSYNDYFQDIEKKVIYFNIFPQFHLKLLFYLKIQRMIFFPNMEMSLKLNDQFHNATFVDKIISAVKAPYFVFSLIAQEIGWKFTTLLFLKLLVDILLSPKNYIMQPESYFDYLKSKGVDPKSIEKAVKNIQ